MSQTITLILVKSLIIESVKNETFFRGLVEKAADQKALTVAYHEQAGNETYQERLLLRGLYTNLSNLKTHLSDYLSISDQSSDDNNIDSKEEEGNIILYLTVSDYFNKGYADPLAKLCSKYIEEAMLMDWWKPVNEKQSDLYAQFVERDLTAIKRCFNKKPPCYPKYPYTRHISIMASVLNVKVGHAYTLTYTIDNGAEDDILARLNNHNIKTGKSKEGFIVKGQHPGSTLLTLFSKHDEDISVTVLIHIQP